MEFSITVLGARGSVPVSGSAFSRYGGATTCVLVHAGEQYILLDAGTGMMSLPEDAMRQDALTLLLTHPHVDHMLGLPLCPYVMSDRKRLDIYAVPRGGKDARTQICSLLAPPLWPVGPELLPADIRFHDLTETLSLGEVTVDAMEGLHPGGVSLLRLTAGGKRLVFATDCTLNTASEQEAAAFFRDCDLALLDGQYSDDEFPCRADFGHNSWGYASRFAARCGVRSLRIIHHDPHRSDSALDAAAEAIRAVNPNYDFAREGEVIRLCQ